MIYVLIIVFELQTSNIFMRQKPCEIQVFNNLNACKSVASIISKKGVDIKSIECVEVSEAAL